MAGIVERALKIPKSRKELRELTHSYSVSAERTSKTPVLN